MSERARARAIAGSISLVSGALVLVLLLGAALVAAHLWPTAVGAPPAGVLHLGAASGETTSRASQQNLSAASVRSSAAHGAVPDGASRGAHSPTRSPGCAGCTRGAARRVVSATLQATIGPLSVNVSAGAGSSTGHSAKHTVRAGPVKATVTVPSANDVVDTAKKVACGLAC